MNTRLLSALGITILALGLWGYVGWNIWNALQEPVAPVVAVDDSDSVRLLGFARATEASRESLKKMTTIDVVSVARAVEDAGKKAGVVVHVGGSTVVAPSTNSKTPPPLDSAFFAVDAEGSFAQLAYFVRLLEVLSTPSQLDQFQLVKTGEASEKKAWRLSARVRVFFVTN